MLWTCTRICQVGARSTPGANVSVAVCFVFRSFTYVVFAADDELAPAGAAACAVRAATVHVGAANDRREGRTLKHGKKWS